MANRFAVLASTNASVLNSLYQEVDRKDFKIDLMVTDRQCGANNFADNYAIPICKINWVNNLYGSNELEKILLDHKIDYLYVFFTRLLKGKILNTFQNKIINFHPALLPDFPGLNGFEASARAETPFIGSTVHYVNEGMDEGITLIKARAEKRNRHIGSLRHIVFAQQCASLFFLHEKLHSSSRLYPLHGSTFDENGFCPDFDAAAINVYKSILKKK